MIRCNPCARGSFSLNDPFRAKDCEPCENNAICLGGNVMFPQLGYWRINSLSDNFVSCSNFGSCL